MPISQATPSPTQAGVTLATYSSNVRFVLDTAKSTIALTTARYADKASYDAGLPPVDYYSFHIEGDAYNAHVAANIDAYNAIKAAIETFLISQPQFTGGTVVP